MHDSPVHDPRRRFLARLLAGASALGPLGALVALGAARPSIAARLVGVARAAEREGPVDENGYLLAHPVSPPPAFDFRYLEFGGTTMYGGRSLAIAAVPRDLAPGERAPLIVLLPGGHHMNQRYDVGVWGWWSEYLLGEAMTALRAAPPLTSKHFWDYALPAQVEKFDAAVRKTPWRHAIVVTPWVVGRQTELEPHGAMIVPFLRDLVARVRRELPVIPTREATGLGGMSAGGMWALYCGARLSDQFGSVIAIQPYTVGLVAPLAEAIEARPHGRAQRVRILTSEDDHQRESTCELAFQLRAAGVELELDEYRGLHRWEFAAGPGIYDTLLHFDRWLRGEELDGSRPFARHDGRRETLVAPGPAPRPHVEATAPNAPSMAGVPSAPNAPNAPNAPDTPGTPRTALVRPWSTLAIGAGAAIAGLGALAFGGRRAARQKPTRG
jgi:predicted esterase